MLYSVFLGLAGFFQTRDEKSAVTDDFTFRLFYGFTSGILFLCTTLVGLQEISGRCIHLVVQETNLDELHYFRKEH